MCGVHNVCRPIDTVSRPIETLSAFRPWPRSCSLTAARGAGGDKAVLGVVPPFWRNTSIGECRKAASNPWYLEAPLAAERNKHTFPFRFDQVYGGSSHVALLHKPL